MEVLIGARAVQGLGVGGLTALVQVVIASMVSPRERGRYSGYIGAVFAPRHRQRPAHRRPDRRHPARLALAASSSALPVAVAAFVVLQKTLHLPVVKREVHIDYLGATLHRRRRLASCWSGSRWPATSSTGSPPPARCMVVAGVARPRRRGLRRGAGRRRAGHPAAPVPRPHHVAGHRRLGADRRRDVRLDGLPQPVLPARPRHVPHRGRPDVDRHGRRAAASPASSPAGSSAATGLLEALPRRRHGRS